MSNVPGIVPNILNNLVSAGASPARAVAIIGHRDTEDGNFPDDTLFYGGDPYSKGVIYNFQSLGDWLTLLGQIDTTDFQIGNQDDNDTLAAVTPHSQANSLLYALALAYLANPSLNVYAGVIDGAFVNGSAWVARAFGFVGSALQTGRLGWYLFVFVIGSLVILRAVT